MGYADLAVGIGMFIFFFALVLTFSINYLGRRPSETLVIMELGDKAVNLFEKLFKTEGTPSDWEEMGEIPSELGLITTIYRIPILVKENNASERLNEPVTIKLVFDGKCLNKVWNNTVRMYDENFNEIKYELAKQVFCTSQFLNESYITFKVNISANEDKHFWIFYSNDTEVPSRNYALTFNANSWLPTDGDSWTEATGNWNRYGGSSGSPAINSTHKWRGVVSIEIDGTFDSNSLGLEYNPTSPITGINNSWYIDAWLYVDDVSNLNGINVSLSDSSDTITKQITDITSSKWYHFERALTSSEWDGWDTFNASKGIDFVAFYMTNSTSGITKTMKVDEFHFEWKPLEVKDYPEETITVVSRKKIEALENISFDELKEITGENYKFRIEIRE